jgi:hypothetical protein
MSICLEKEKDVEMFYAIFVLFKNGSGAYPHAPPPKGGWAKRPNRRGQGRRMRKQ